MQRNSLKMRNGRESAFEDLLALLSRSEFPPVHLKQAKVLLSHLHDMTLCVLSPLPTGEVLAVRDAAVYVMACSA